MKVFNYKFWLELVDKTFFELLCDLGLLQNNQKQNKKVNKTLTTLENNVNCNNFVFFHQKWLLKNNVYVYLLDLVFIFFTFLNYKSDKNLLFKYNRSFVRNSQIKNKFLYNSTQTSNYKTFLSLANYGWTSIFRAFRYWFLTLLLGCVIVYYCLVVKLLPFNKVVFSWFMALMFFYWLISGFVFFIKKYQYRYFTSSIQRFWRRCFAIFWMLEAYLFLWFAYLTLNANQEPVFMYDNIQVYKTHFFSWKLFLLKLFPVTLLIIFTYFLILSLKWNTFTKTNYLCLIITAMLFYMVWLEFYQFFHLLSFYGNLNWVYDIEDHLWNLEVDFKRTRVSNHFVTICLVAKFWHVIFALVFWLFFIIRGLEISRLRYPLLSANFQNFIIIYVMGWMYMYPWVKYLGKKFLEMPYFWFYINNRRLFVYMFFNDLKLFYTNIFSFVRFKPYFNVYDFYYWHESSKLVGYTQFRKNFIRDMFIKNIF